MKELKKWFTAIANIVKHEELIRLQIDSHVLSANNFAAGTTKRIDALEKRLNTAELAAAGTRSQVIDLQQKLAIAVEELAASTNALANHDDRVKRMEALILRKVGMLPRRS